MLNAPAGIYNIPYGSVWYQTGLPRTPTNSPLPLEVAQLPNRKAIEIK